MPPAPVVHWNSAGWKKLGTRTVNGRMDSDVIDVSIQERFKTLTLVVEDSDLELIDMEVTFFNTETFHPDVKHYFRENSRTREIALPNGTRIIKKITLKYRNIPGGGNATVEVWGK